VTVINFLAKDNETQRLTFDILSRKLELFGTVLDASDQVLHRGTGASGEVLVSALGAEFEGELRRIYERARTVDEVHDELRALRDRVEEERRRFEETNARTASVLAERFDEEVQKVFRKHQAALPAALAELDADLQRVVGAPTTERLHLSHPLVVEAVRSARAVKDFAPARVTVRDLKKKGPARLRLVKLGVDGFERVEALLPVMVFADGEVLDPADAALVLRGTFSEGGGVSGVDARSLDDAMEQAVFFAQAGLDAAEHHRYERATLQGERFIEDRLLVLRKRQNVLAERLELATLRRDGATGSEAREDAERSRTTLATQHEALDVEVERLTNRDDPRFQRHHAHLHQRRYTPPRLETLFELDLVIE